MKNIFAKLITTIMLGSMLLGAASAQTTEKRWVKVSDIFSSALGDFEGDLESICIGIADLINSDRQKVEYLGGSYFDWQTNYIIGMCPIKSTPPWVDIYRFTPFSNKGGTFEKERPDGCYELKETTENCHVVGTSEGYPVCGDEFINGPLCDEITPLEDQAGGIACNGTDSSICFWDHPLKEYGDTEARKAIKECMIGHEKNHKDDKNMRCIIEDNKEVGQFGNKDDALLAQSEQNAYRAEVKCLRDKMDEDKENVCANSKTPMLCNSELKKTIDKQREKLAFYSMWLIKNEVRK